MALNFTFNFGRLFGKNERVTTAKLNAVVKGITASLTGTVGTADITDGSITPAKVQQGAWFFALATLSGSTYTAAYTPSVAGYVDGLFLCFQANAANTGAASLDAGAGAKPLRKFGGKVLNTGDIKAGQNCTVRYNSTLVAGGCWELVGVPGQPLPDDWYYGAGVQTAGTYAVTVPLAPVAYSAGLRIVFAADTANTGAVLVNVNTLGNKAVQLNGAALVGNEIMTGQNVALIYDGAAFQILGGVTSQAAGPVVGATRNLIVQNNTGTPNTQIDIDADEVVVKSSGGNAVLLSNVNLTINAAVNGANGLDAGGLANTSWYYAYVIWNGTTTAGLLSLSATAPTLPAGYTHKALMGSVRTDGAAHFWVFYAQDRETFLRPQNVFTARAGLLAYTVESLASFTPPIAKQVKGNMGIIVGGSNCGIEIAADANGLGASLVAGEDGGPAVDSFILAGRFRTLLTTAQTVYLRMSTTAADYRLDVTGYSI